MTGKPEDDGLAEIKRLLRTLEDTSAATGPPPSATQLEPKSPLKVVPKAVAAPEVMRAPVPEPALSAVTVPPPPPVVRTAPRTRRSGALLMVLIAIAMAASALAFWWPEIGLLSQQALLPVAQGRLDATPSPAPAARAEPQPQITARTTPPPALVDTPAAPPRPEAVSPTAPGPTAAPPITASQVAAPAESVRPAVEPTAQTRLAQAAPQPARPAVSVEPSRPPPKTAELKLRVPARLVVRAGERTRLPIEIEPSLPTGPPAVVAITGLPAVVTLSRGAPSATGGWNLGVSDLADLWLSAPEAAAGRHALIIELRSIDAAVLASVRTSLEVAAAPAQAPAPPPMADAARPPESTTGEWLVEGLRLLRAGHIASARLILERAADSGLAEAARHLGDSYDPAKLYALGVRGMSGDVQKAIYWYERADELGDSQAKARLLGLGQR